MIVISFPKTLWVVSSYGCSCFGVRSRSSTYQFLSNYEFASSAGRKGENNQTKVDVENGSSNTSDSIILYSSYALYTPYF